MDAGGLIFGSGSTLALFHIDGTLPSRTLALKIAHSGSASHGAKSRMVETFAQRLGKPQGLIPVATVLRHVTVSIRVLMPPDDSAKFFGNPRLVIEILSP